MNKSIAANFPDESLPAMSSVTKTGVYYGYAQIYCPKHQPALLEDDAKVLPMVMSLGWNPFYKNERMTAVRRLVCYKSFRILKSVTFRKYIYYMSSMAISMGMK